MSPSRKPSATHAMPPPDFTTTPCCGLLPTELPPHHVITPDLRAVTCQGARTSPLGELIAITLTGTRRLGPALRPFLPHGEDYGHVYDERCALCAGDVPRLTDQVAEALITALPTIDVNNLRATPPRPGASARAQALQRSRLRHLITATLTTTPATGIWADGGFTPHGQPAHTAHEPRCALCTADADVLADAIEAALRRSLPSVLPPPARRPRTTITHQGAP